MEASWIWDASGEHPRNYWACFRKSFDLHAAPDGATLSVFADSRYVAYVNGVRVGQGPVRGWPEAPFYDEHPVGGLLRKGPNVVAVLVHHLGSSSMQYVEAEACLTGQLDLAVHGRTMKLVTDESWKSLPHAGYARNAIRNYPQQGWSEIYDAAALDDAWTGPDFDDAAWKSALRIPASSRVWRRKLQRRDIPLMREDAMYPERIHGSRIVRTHGMPVTAPTWCRTARGRC